MRVETIGRATLYLGDCREVLPTLGKVDAVVTDPPYGIGTGKQKMSPSGSLKWPEQEWDNEPAFEALELALQKGLWHIVWGGNYYILPPSRCWLIWDKGQPDAWYSTAHFEMAWTNMDRNARAFRMSQVEAYGSMDKKHPSQKPLPLMKWCVNLLPETEVVLDPFMGSGTTGVATMELGKQFIGIEREPAYFDIACRRIEQAQRQGDLFIENAA